MASRVAINDIGNLPVRNVKVAEGTVTRSDVVVRGAIEEDVNVYSAPVVKGDLVRLVTTATDKEFICVEKAAAGNDLDYMIGIVVSDPRGDDQVTVSGQTPVVADQRMADVAFLGFAIVEVEVDAEMDPMDVPALSESENNIFGVGAHPGTTTANGALVALRFGVNGEKVPFLVGYAGYLPKD